MRMSLASLRDISINEYYGRRTQGSEALLVTVLSNIFVANDTGKESVWVFFQSGLDPEGYVAKVELMWFNHLQLSKLTDYEIQNRKCNLGHIKQEGITAIEYTVPVYIPGAF